MDARAKRRRRYKMTRGNGREHGRLPAWAIHDDRVSKGVGDFSPARRGQASQGARLLRGGLGVFLDLDATQ